MLAKNGRTPSEGTPREAPNRKDSEATMLESLTNYYTEFGILLRDNPVVAGAFSLWGLAAVSFICVRLPGKMADFVKRFFTVSLELRSFAYNEHYDLVDFYAQQFLGFHKWLQKQKIIFSRTTQLNKHENGKFTNATIGLGVHLIYAKSTFFLVAYREADSSNTASAKYIVDISCFGVSTSKFNKIIDEFKIEDVEKNYITVELNEKDWWEHSYNLRLRGKNSVIINHALKDKLFNSLQWFVENQDFFIERGLNYKKVIMLHGPPGTGKTSLIKAIASEFKRRIYFLSLADCTPGMLRNLVVTAKTYSSIIVIEDIDTITTIYEREKSNKQIPPHDGANIPKEKEENERISLSRLALTDVLNVLDGMNTPDGAIFILTANNLDRLDRAVLRKGRIDETYHIDLLQDEEIKEYSKMVYPGIAIPGSVKFKPTAGCDLQDMFLSTNSESEYLGLLSERKEL
jgi:chaperone BCS1